MYKRIILVLTVVLFSLTLFAQQGYEIKVKINGFDQKEMQLAYHYGDKQYIKSTATAGADGYFVFSGEEKLESGIYMVVLPPDNNYFEILIDDNEQHMSIITDHEDLVGGLIFQGNSLNNQLFYNYLSMVSNKRVIADKLQKELEETSDDSDRKREIMEELEAMEKEVQNYSKRLIENHPESLTASLLGASMELEFPEYTGSQEEIQYKMWRYAQKHFFDNVNLNDSRLLRSPVLTNKVDYYVQQLQINTADSISAAIDYVLSLMNPEGENFKFFLIHYLNKYASSSIVGMDGVYVHLAKTYYATGKAPWTDPEQLQKIIDNANALDPLLLGKVAPDINLQMRNGYSASLHSGDADFTVLFFWESDNQFSLLEALDLQDFFNEYKNSGISIYAVCLNDPGSMSEAWSFIEENDLDAWLHVSAKNSAQLDAVKGLYNIKSVPVIYLLDENKEILSKRINSDQLKSIVEMYID